MYICGAVKTSTIKQGTITVGTQILYFGNPLDGLFTTMLSWFSARYLLADYKNNSTAAATQKAVPDDPSELRLNLFEQNDDTSDILAQFGLPEPVPQPKKNGPSEEDEALAKVLESHNGLVLALGQALQARSPDEKAEDDELRKYLKTHNKMMGLLKAALASYEWTGDDKVGDRVGKDYCPPTQAAGPTLPVSLATNKRRKVDEPQVAVSLPILPSALPPKTPERKKIGGPHHITGYGNEKEQ